MQLTKKDKLNLPCFQKKYNTLQVQIVTIIMSKLDCIRKGFITLQLASIQMYQIPVDKHKQVEGGSITLKCSKISYLLVFPISPFIYIFTVFTLYIRDFTNWSGRAPNFTTLSYTTVRPSIVLPESCPSSGHASKTLIIVIVRVLLRAVLLIWCFPLMSTRSME